MTGLRVGLVGWGAIGRTVGEALRDGRVDGAELVGVTTRSGRGAPGVRCVSPDELIGISDVVVEAAGHDAVRAIGASVLDAGRELVVVSVGALADEALHQRLREAGGDRLHVVAGAIGGLDVVDALRAADALDSVVLVTTKPSTTLERPWMPDELLRRLGGTEPVVCFDGTAREAATRFPESLNVAATLAVAVGSWDDVRVRLVGDPVAERNRHVVELDGPLGRHRVEMANAPSADNPRTSAIVPASVVATVGRLVRDRNRSIDTGRTPCARPA